jgi:hypothetical protein
MDIDTEDYIIWRLNTTADFSLSWFVAFVSLFVGVIALLPELRIYTSWMLTGLFCGLYEAMVLGAVFSINRVMQLSIERMKLEQKLGKKIRDAIWNSRNDIFEKFFKYDNDGNLLSLRQNLLIVLYGVYVCFWTLILTLKLSS